MIWVIETEDKLTKVRAPSAVEAIAFYVEANPSDVIKDTYMHSYEDVEILWSGDKPAGYECYLDRELI